MDAIDAAVPPNQILGYRIRSKTRIYVSYLLPAILEVIVYITQTVADTALSYQYFHTREHAFGIATLLLLILPPTLTFIIVLSSREQWANPKYSNRTHFVLYHILQLLFFPLFAVYRYGVRIFWSVEALFHDDDDDEEERMQCLAKAAECSTCELYHFIQAYAQSAPQIILQLYHMLTQDLFRNYETTTVQAISLVFSAINLADITTTYQRFESQHKVGRHYPWSTPQQVEAQRQILRKHEAMRQECEQRKRDSERTITSFPESDKIMSNFKLKSLDSPEQRQSQFLEPITHSVQIEQGNEVDNDTAHSIEAKVTLHNPPTESIAKINNATDDDKIRVKPNRRFGSMRDELKNLEVIECLDTVPESPAPSPPPQLNNETLFAEAPPELRAQNSFNSQTDAQRNRSSKALSQLDTFKNMLLMNAQLYIKEHVPHPPKLLLRSLSDDDKNSGEQADNRSTVQPPMKSPMTPEDVVDFFLPRPTQIIDGIHQDDCAGKTIAFFGWILFIIMRMLSMATFCVFYPKEFFILFGIHYALMLAGLCLESKCKDKTNRTIFYLLLAYVYIFVLLEFRIKFKHIKLWYIGYFIITMIENLTTTLLWYIRVEFESWWFEFIFESIMYSGVLFIASLVVYYFLLKPSDVTLVVE